MRYKVVCFDLDGTIVDGIESIWYYLHRQFRVPDEDVKRWHHWYNEGKVTYEQWFQQDIIWWNSANARRSDFLRAFSALNLVPGANEAIKELKKRGAKVAIVSGSLNIVVEYFFPPGTFDHVFINDIYFDKKGKISGYRVSPYDFLHKATAIRRIAEKEGVGVDDCAFVGDHYNDVEAMKVAGLGIAFNPKSKEVERVADLVIRKNDLREVLVHL
jgi:phosphoserine phosphatase